MQDIWDQFRQRGVFEDESSEEGKANADINDYCTKQSRIQSRIQQQFTNDKLTTGMSCMTYG